MRRSEAVVEFEEAVLEEPSVLVTRRKTSCDSLQVVVNFRVYPRSSLFRRGRPVLGLFTPRPVGPSLNPSVLYPSSLTPTSPRALTGFVLQEKGGD